MFNTGTKLRRWTRKVNWVRLRDALLTMLTNFGWWLLYYGIAKFFGVI